MNFSDMRSKMVYPLEEEKQWEAQQENAKYVKQYLTKEGGSAPPDYVEDWKFLAEGGVENPPEITGVDEEFLDKYFAKYAGSLEGLQIETEEETSETIGGVEENKITVIGDFYEESKTGGSKESASTVNPQVKKLFGVSGGADATSLDISQSADDLSDSYPQDLTEGGAYSFDEVLSRAGASFSSVPEPEFERNMTLEEAIEKVGGEYTVYLAGPGDENPSYPSEDEVFGGAKDGFDGPDINEILN